jgi:glucokinase
MGTIVAVDIGGTQLRAASYADDTLRPIAQKRGKTLASEPDAFGRLIQVIEGVWPKNEKVEAIGVASPGPLNPHTGFLIAPPNIHQWRNFPLAPKLSEHFGVPAFLENDANLACLAEWKFGAGMGHHDVLYLTISTGIGGGVIINDRLLQGFHGMAAEVGHMVVLPGGPLCGCGHKGHIEALASGPSIVRYVLEELEAGARSSLKRDDKLSAREIADAARAGDALAKSAFERAGKYLGIAVANLLHIFDPSILIFGGGVSQSGPLLFDPFEASLKEQIITPRYLDDLVITTARFGDDAGLLGAFAFAQISLKPK